MPEYDHVVIGAGIVGSWTALHIAQQGKKVLLLEQFCGPHTRGSSHGASRLTRSSYEESFFAEMMPYAYERWQKAEEDSGKKLLEQCGCINIFKSPSEEHVYQSCVSNMKTYSPKHLDPQEKKEELFTRALHFKEKPHAVLYDKSGGILFAHRAVVTIQELFRREGGHLRDNCQVTSIVPKGDEVEVVTLKDRIVVRSVVVCAGAWTQKLLVPDLISSLPLQPTAVKLYYWKIKEAGAYSIAAGFPAYLDHQVPNVYALPSVEYPGLMKVTTHAGDAPCDPDKRDQAFISPDMELKIKEYVSQHFPLLEKEPAIVETCMYTLTPDEIFLIDRVPGHENIIFGSGFSGTGFKTSPTVGRLLSEMATGKQPFLDMSHYSLSRFAQKAEEEESSV